MQPLFVYLKSDMTTKLNSKNYIDIADWMVTEYPELSSRELILFAIIYGFSQDGVSCYKGGLKYLARWLNVKESQKGNISRSLQSLVDKNMLLKKEIIVNKMNTFCEYRTKFSRGRVSCYDNVTIKPFMIEDLKLKDKKLLLYALIYKHSVPGSGSFYTGGLDYIAKWLNLTDSKDYHHIKERYIKPLIRQGLLEVIKEGDVEKYRAVVPKGNLPKMITPPNTEKEVSQNDNTSSQIDNTNSQNDNVKNPKMITKSISSKLLNNYEYSYNNNINVVNTKSFKDNLLKSIEASIISSNEFNRFFEARDIKTAIDASNKLLEMIKKQNIRRLPLIAQFTEEQIIRLFKCSLNATQNIGNTFTNPDGYLVARINDEIALVDD